jgi:UDP-2,4-diacetamido-2,4,6-trideoxy-beta-L-altropyranose hydrolase
MTAPVVAFRTVGGEAIGFGHVRRCMTLAQALAAEGAEVHFVVDAEPTVEAILRGHGFDVMGVSGDDERELRETARAARAWGARALVCDSYEIRGECLPSLPVSVVAVIDDLAGRPLPVELVINSAAGASDLAYETDPRTKLLLGPTYALLRAEFAEEPARDIGPTVSRVLITVGGADPTELTPRLMACTRAALPDAGIDVVMGPLWSAESRERLDWAAAEDTAITVHHDPPRMRDLMLGADLAVAGGGQTLYELAATGTPTVAIQLASNQRPNLQGLNERGVLAWAGDVADLDVITRVGAALGSVSHDRARRRAMSRCGRRLVDGYGARRVAHALLEACGR